MTEDPRDEETRMRDVPDDQPTEPGGASRDKTTVNRQQDTPPAGYQVQSDDQPTEQRSSHRKRERRAHEGSRDRGCTPSSSVTR